MTSLRTTTQVRAGGTCLSAVGEIDLATSPQLGDAIDAALAATPTGGRLTIDFCSVTFLDCAGISTLLASRATAQHRRISVGIAGARGIVGWILHVTRLDTELATRDAPTRTAVNPHTEL
jgi:anti-anti-sigma factor